MQSDKKVRSEKGEKTPPDLDSMDELSMMGRVIKVEKQVKELPPIRYAVLLYPVIRYSFWQPSQWQCHPEQGVLPFSDLVWFNISFRNGYIYFFILQD